MDKFDKKIISVLEKGKEYTMSDVIVKSFTREKREVFKRRLEKLQEKRFINFNQSRMNKNRTYIVSIKDELNLGVAL